MAKKKSKKIEKETRRLIEGISDLVKKKGDKYKFRTGKKKQIREIKKTCAHWIIRKGKEYPTVINDPDNGHNWKCTICGASFPVAPESKDKNSALIKEMLGRINQLGFYMVQMGGDADDTKVILRLKKDLLRFDKMQKNISKQLDKRRIYEENRDRSDTLSQFGSFAGFNYKP